MKFKRLLSLVASAAMTISALCGAMSITASADDSSGTDGDVSWHFYETEGKLEITATGAAMTNYTMNNSSSAPWYSQRAKITKVKIGNGVTSIGDYSFYNYTAITELELSSTITSIGEDAFRGCTGLQSVQIPGSVKTINREAFRGCTGLQSIQISDSVKTIGQEAFEECSGFTSIEIPGSVETIGGSAFSDCSKLQSVILARGIKELETGAFQYCTALETISLPSTIETLGTNVFKNCSTLESVMIPAAVTKIPNGAFTGCTNLSSVDLPDSITTIEPKAFENCSSLGSIELPKELTSVTAEAFVGCTSLTEFKADPESMEFTNPESDSYKGVLLSKDGKKLIAYPAALESTSVSFSSINSAINSIGDYAFYKNTKIKTIDMDNKLISIGNYSFNGCTSITSSLSFSKDDIESIGNNAFEGCTGVKKISGLDGSKLTSIGDSAFNGCNVDSVVLGSKTGSLSLGDSAFNGCKKLATVDLGENVNSIGKGTFDGCILLTAISIPDNVESIGSTAFKGCSALKTVKLPKNLSKIDKSTFADCTSLVSLKLPNKITMVDNYAFARCPKLEEMVLPNSVETLGTNIFLNDTALTKVVLGDKITTIPDKTFFNCTNEDLEIYLMGTIKTITANGNNGSFGGANANYVKGTIYVYDETSYTTISAATAVTTANYASLKYVADFTELRAALEEAKSYPEIDYTDASYGALSSAIMLADMAVANYMSTQETVDVAVANLRSAIEKLVIADNSEMLAKVAEVAQAAEDNYIRSDYRANLYDDLRTAYLAGQNVTGDELNSELQKLIDDIHKAEDNLFVAYAYPDPVLTVKSDGNTYGWKIPAMSGVTTAEVAGATKAKITFQCASHVYFGSGTTFNFHSVITRSAPETKDGFVMIDDEDDNKLQEGSGQPATGLTYDLTFDLVEPLQEGDVYNIYTYTYSWNKPEYEQYGNVVFYIKEIQLLNAEGETVLSTKDVIVPNEELKAAVEKANAVDTTNAPADKAQALQDAIAAGEAVLEEELPLPSAMEAAVTAIQDAIDALSEPSVDTKALDEAIKNAEAMDTSAYTDESVATLTEAIKNAKDVLANGSATKEDVEAAEKAISDAIAALAKKQSDSSNPSDPSNGGSSTPTVTEPTTADPAVRAAKDKADAQKLMNQAKITKLTVKSKAKKKITVTWKKVSTAKGYQVQVSKKNKFNKKNIILNKFTSKKKLTVTKKIKSRKTYFVRVRAYATYKDANNVTKKVYSKWIKKLRKVKVK